MSRTAHPRPLARALSASLIAIALACVPGTAAASAGADRCAGALDVPTAGTTEQAAAAVLCLVDAERTDRGLRALRLDPGLGRAASGFAADLVRRGYFSHVSPGGGTLRDRLGAVGYGRADLAWRAGEVLGWGTGSRATPAACVNAWLNSAEHRRLLLAGDFTELGIGIATGVPTATRLRLPGATYAVEVGVVHG